MSRRLSPLVVLALLAACACTDPSAKLPNYGVVPAVGLVDSAGAPFSTAALRGKVSVVDFIYTNCPGPCPMMTSRMHRIRQIVRNEPDVQLLSISVDPAHDSPPVLHAFANRFGGPQPDWHFLTGSPANIHLLAREVFKVGDLITEMEHSTKFMLVDKHANLRGYYSSFQEDGENGIEQLLGDIEKLRHQRP